MSDYQDVRPVKQRKTQDQHLQHGLPDHKGSSDDVETEEAEEQVDESTTSSGSENLEEISSSEAESSSSEEDDEEGLSVEGARISGLSTAPKRETSLQSRLQEFLPQLQQANAELDGMEDDKRIDEVSDDAEHYIEMDLGLGVLTEKENETDKVKIPRSEDQEDHAGGEGADEFKAEPPIGGFLPDKRASKRKIEELG